MDAGACVISNTVLFYRTSFDDRTLFDEHIE